MTIEELQKQIAEELKIDKNSLDSSSSENPLLMQKYINLFLRESNVLNKLQSQFSSLYKDKTIFYKTDFKYVPDNFRELNAFVEGDEEMIAIKEKIANQNSIVKFLSDTISTFKDRGWAIKNMIDFRRFMAGE